jgi:lipoate-protein ligase A
MALDESLLRFAAGRGRPLLRIYAWSEPSISIGYFQKFPAELAQRYRVVRRPTGGGLVYHTADTTYTVIAPPRHALATMSTSAAYCAIHKAVVAAMQTRAELCASEIESPRGGYECFQKPVAGDVMAGGQKLAGAAQRRTKWGMLHQGSIAARVTAEQLQRGFDEVLNARFEPYRVSAAEQQLAEELAREKYASAERSRS